MTARRSMSASPEMSTLTLPLSHSPTLPPASSLDGLPRRHARAVEREAQNRAARAAQRLGELELPARLCEEHHAPARASAARLGAVRARVPREPLQRPHRVGLHALGQLLLE